MRSSFLSFLSHEAANTRVNMCLALLGGAKRPLGSTLDLGHFYLSKSLSLSCWKLWHLLFFREAIQPGRGKHPCQVQCCPPSGAAPQWKAAITTQGFEVPRCSPTFELHAKEQMNQSSREIAFPSLNWRPKHTLSAWRCRATPTPGERRCFHSLEGSVFCNRGWQTEGLFSRLELACFFLSLKGQPISSSGSALGTALCWL